MSCEVLKMGKYAISILCLFALLSQVRCLRKFSSEDEIKLHYRSVFSDNGDGGFSQDAKDFIVDLHNFYRSKLTPPAADMKLLEWDDELEEIAQTWADRCQRYGRSQKSYSKGEYGQLKYKGEDRSGFEAVKKWFTPDDEYDAKTVKCTTFGGCHNYMQAVWAKSSRIGCGIAECSWEFYVFCMYEDRAEYNEPLYTVGVPCSQCRDEDETRCWNNLCISNDQCERNQAICEQDALCNLACHNCGQLNTASCRCACPDGWDARDCSRPCGNENEGCGGPVLSDDLCSIRFIQDEYCRLMCGQCKPISEESQNTCCAGKLCEKGYVLNTSTCLCKKLCPGPLCAEYEGDEEVSA